MPRNKINSLLQLYRLANHKAFKATHFSNQREVAEIVGLLEEGCKWEDGRTLNSPMFIGWYVSNKVVRLFDPEDKEWC